MAYQSFFGSGGGGGSPGAGGGGSYHSYFGFKTPTYKLAPQPDNSTSLLSTKADLQANAKKQQQNNNASTAHHALNALDGFLNGAGHVAVGVGKTVAQPFEDVGQAAAKQVKALSGPTSTQAQRDQIMSNQAKAANNPQYKAATKGGGPSSVQGTIQAEKAAAGGAKAPAISSIVQKDNATTGGQNKKAIGDVLQIASDVVGGGEAKAAIKGVKDVSTALKVAKTAKAAAPLVAASGVSGGGSVVANNPKATAADVAKGVGAGIATGVATVGAGKALGAGFKMIFGKKPDITAAPKTPTPIEVTDKSTGTTKGTVSNALPTSTGADKAPVIPSTRPSSAGYTDTEFRQIFNKPSQEVAKNTPAVADAFAKTGSKDPTTLAVQTLADTTTKSKAGGIIKTLLPDLNKSDSSALAANVAKTKDPQEVSHLLYDAAQNHEAQQNAASSLVGTPMDKSISFNNPSDLENAQRQQLHVRVAQINKAIDNHATGATEQAPETLNTLLKSRQTAQDVLNGKTTYDAAYGSKAAPAPVKPLPFLGDAAEPKANPQGIVDKIPTVAAGDATRQATVNRKAAIAATMDTFKPQEATAAWKKLNANDQNLVQSIEAPGQMSAKAADASMVRIAKSKADNPEDFINYARLHQQDMQTLLAHRQALHPEMGQLSNYFPHIYDRGDKTTQDFLAARENKYALAVKNSKPGYTQHRVIPTYAEADKILGKDGQPLLKRANANVHEDYLQALNAVASENGKAALVKGLKEAHGSSSVFNVGVSPTGDSLGNLKIAGGHGISMPDALAEHYNNRAPVTPPVNPNLGSKAYQAYRTVNQGGKNTIFAGGLFHGPQSALTIGGQQLLSTIRHPMQIADNLRLIGDTFSPKMREAHLHTLTENGADHPDGLSSIERQRLANLTFTGKDVKADVGTANKRGLLNSIPGVKQLHDLVFDRQLPASKQMIFDQRTADLNFHNPSDLAKARDIAAGLNDIIGGIPTDTQGLSPKWAQRLNNVLLARDYQQGRVTTVGKAFTKWGANNPAGQLAREAIVGKAIVTALPGMIALVAAGKLDPTNLKEVGKAYAQQLLSPQIPTSWRTAPSKSSPKGNPVSLKLPSTHIADIAKILSPLIDPKSTFDNNRTSGLKDFASSRLAFIPAAAEKIKTNRDFYGQPIFTGKPGETARNVAEQFAPIPVAQGAKAASGNSNVGEAALNEVGLRASGSTLPNDTAHARRLNEFKNLTGYRGSITLDRQKVINQMRDLSRQGNFNQAHRIAQEFNASLPQRTIDFRTKYMNNYNPAFDTEFLKLKIPTSAASDKSRVKAIQQSDAVLQ